MEKIFTDSSGNVCVRDFSIKWATILFLLFHVYQGSEGYPKECAPKGSSTVPMAIVVMICSLVIAWLELWVFEFQVIPKERRDAESEYLKE